MKSKYKVGQLVEYALGGDGNTRFSYITAVVMKANSVSYQTDENNDVQMSEIQNAFKPLATRKTKKAEKPVLKKKSSKKAENSTSL